MTHSLKILIFVFLIYQTQLMALSVIDIKGVMLQRISSFISWPQLPQKSMSICIVGNDDFAKHLQTLYKHKNLHGLPIKIISRDSTPDKETLLTCNVIYIDNSDKIINISKTLKSSSILVVGSKSENIYNGATIVLYQDKNRFKIIINKKSLDEKQLKADYRLLKLAKVIENGASDEVK